MRIFLIIFLCLSVSTLNAKDEKIKDSFALLNFFGSVLDRVEREYVDPVPFENLIDFAVDGLLSGLDRHSHLVKSDEYKDMKTLMSGEFGGLGIEIVFEDGLIRIVTPMDDSPAQKAGLMSGDLITHVFDKPIKGMDSDKALEKLKGKPGTEVKIHVRRDKEGLDFTIKRELIKTKPVKVRREGDFVVARIATFMDGKTTKKFIAEYKKIEKDKKPIKGMVLDLRNNGGGLLDEAIAVTSLFIDKGKEVVSTRGRKKSDIERYQAVGNTYFKEMPLVVLINRATASAPEIVAGALKDYKRAIIMGEQSYGKGSVQSVIPLKDKRAIRLTTARYYTPSGETIQDEGVKPDIEVPLGILEKIDLGPRFSEKDLAKGVKRKNQDQDDDEDIEEAEEEKTEKDEKDKKHIPGMPNLKKLKEKKAKKEKKKDDTKTDTKKDEVQKNEDKGDKKALEKLPIDYQTERALDLLKSMSVLKQMK